MSSSTFEDAVREAESAATRSIVDRIAERMTGHATAAAVFAPAVERDGVTVIPVAAVRYGFGGGQGSGRKAGKSDAEGESGEGAGGGGGASASPVGFIEIRNGQATFQRISRPTDIIPVALGGAVALWVAMRALRSLFH